MIKQKEELTIENSIKKWLESPEYEEKKRLLRKELDAETAWFPVDFETFHLTKRERIDLENAKLENRRARQRYYGKDANKYLNVPSK